LLPSLPLELPVAVPVLLLAFSTLSSITETLPVLKKMEEEESSLEEEEEEAMDLAMMEPTTTTIMDSPLSCPLLSVLATVKSNRNSWS
jgi:hypothetical protein